jgi:hypothetical protein
MVRAPKEIKPKKVFSLQAKLMQAIRKVWRNSPERNEAIALAKDPSKPQYTLCAICGASVHKKLIAVDHLEAVSPLGFTDWNETIYRLFCPSKGLQILCESCHRAKSKTETQIRASHKRSLKPPKPPKIPKRKASPIQW